MHTVLEVAQSSEFAFADKSYHTKCNECFHTFHLYILLNQSYHDNFQMKTRANM